MTEEEIFTKIGILMPLFPKYIDKIKKEYSVLNPNKSKQFNFTSMKDEKKGFFSKKSAVKNLIYQPNAEQINAAYKILEYIKNSLKIYITNLIPPLEDSLFVQYNNSLDPSKQFVRTNKKKILDYKKIKNIMIENKNKEKSIGRGFLQWFCDTQTFTHYLEQFYQLV